MWSPIGDPPLDVTSGNVPLMTIILYMLEGTYVCTPGLFAMEGIKPVKSHERMTYVICWLNFSMC